MRDLWPPINVIQSNLQPRVGEIHILQDAQIEPTFASEENTVQAEMPAFIRDKVRKRLAAREAYDHQPPQAGQICRFDGDDQNLVPLCVLLDRPQDEHRWTGWLVSAETDYATNKDVLLEPQDEPFDPLASMVQTWNPVTVDVRKVSRVMAQLAPQRMAAIKEVAAGSCEEGGGARAGFVAPLKTHSGEVVLSGTRIIHAEDPRRQYRELYLAAAKTLELQHLTSNIVRMPDRQRFMRNVGWSLAASIVLAQSAIIANLMQDQQGAAIQPDQYQEYRSAPQSQSGYIYLQVIFKPDAKEIDIRKLLTKLNASIVEGPGEFGEYVIKVKMHQKINAFEAIEESGLTELVGQSKRNSLY